MQFGDGGGGVKMKAQSWKNISRFLCGIILTAEFQLFYILFISCFNIANIFALFFNIYDNWFVLNPYV